jgi:phosphatidylglycerophosphatase A
MMKVVYRYRRGVIRSKNQITRTRTTSKVPTYLTLLYLYRYTQVNYYYRQHTTRSTKKQDEQAVIRDESRAVVE